MNAKLLFVFLFFQTGQGFPIQHEAPAQWPSQRPILKMENCIIEAERRQAQMNRGLEGKLDGIEDVIILCRYGEDYENK